MLLIFQATRTFKNSDNQFCKCLKSCLFKNLKKCKQTTYEKYKYKHGGMTSCFPNQETKITLIPTIALVIPKHAKNICESSLNLHSEIIGIITILNYF